MRTPDQFLAAAARLQLLQAVAGIPPAQPQPAPTIQLAPAEDCNVIPHRSVDVPMTRQQRAVVEELEALISDLRLQFGLRLSELAAAVELQGIAGINPATVRSVLCVAGLVAYQTEYRLAQDTSARMRAVRVGSFTADEPKQVAA
ncbi:hypothetical protein [Jeongeupia chitinilytica]|uniref:Uncharacterized protein n=1 Tax=Jeongeupia chitinilytica TaxID=1041641 RepID=A0ABQ3GYE1_9NEIS|nr:hypothetical protein [Jeongeupia chitinilytica]GHD59782.1 hypothetical protein GCM10007350_11520 [Jeongeupia chitinilytica]